jgi:pyridinium-3,5-bisthiocarboxylic acid mononucleotide nickel chelatase
MSRVAWFHCFAGITGTNALGALVDAGADLDEIRAMVERLPIGGWALGAEPTQRAGVGATSVVIAHDDDPSVVRTFAHVSALIEEARLPDRVRERSLDVLSMLAQVEGALHGVSTPKMQMHATGGPATIVSVVGTCAALELLGIDEVLSSAVAQGSGMVRGPKGVMQPVPQPMVVGLFAERSVPTYGHEISVELTTPTGAAIISALATSFGPMPRMRPSVIGYGAGERDLDGLPNAVQVVIGERIPREHLAQRLVQLDTNVDDVNGTVLGHTVSALMDAGAVDAWMTSTVSGHGRPAQIVSAVCDPTAVEQVALVLLRETGALSVRSHAVDRWAASRQIVEVDVAGYPLQIQVGPGRVKAEADDAAVIARRTGLPLREVLSRAEAAWRRASEVRQLHPAAQPLDAEQ